MSKKQKDMICRLADYIVSEGTEHTEDGRWANTYDELYYHFGASITDSNGNGKLLREELQRREQVAEVILTEECIEVAYHLQYCENCKNDPLEVLSVIGCNIYDEHDFESAAECAESVPSIVGGAAMAGKIKSIHGIYKKHGREAFLEAAAYYSDHVNVGSIDKTIDEMESRWYDDTHRQTEAEKMVEDYNNGQTILNDPDIACTDIGQAMVM